MKFMYYTRQKHNKDTSVRYHYHNCYELIYCSSGSGYLNYVSNPFTTPSESIEVQYVPTEIYTDKSLILHDNSVVLLRPCIVHNEIYIGATDLISIGLYLSEDETEIINNISIVDIDDSVKFLLNNIEKEFKTKSYKFIDNIQAYLTIAINDILRYSDKKTDILNNTQSMDYIINFINEYFKTTIDPQMLANMSGYCLDHFRLLFKKITGTTLKQYIINKRMEYANSLIKNSDLSLYQISEECGYSDYFQFSTYYKKHFGKAPRQTRKASV